MRALGALDLHHGLITREAGGAGYGGELDLLVFINGRRIGFEFKYADAPPLTKSLGIARADLQLEHVFIVYPGNRSYPLDSWADVVALHELPTCLAPMLKSGKVKRRRSSAKGLNSKRSLDEA